MKHWQLYPKSMLLFFVLFSWSPVLAQISFVKTIGTSAQTNNVTSTAITVATSGVASGNSVILSLALNPSAGGVSCSDTRGNLYTVDRDVTNGAGNSGVRTVVLSAHNIVALTGGNTISCVHPKVSTHVLSASEFSGLASSAVVDQVQSATGAATTATSGFTPATSQTTELLIGAIGVEGPLTDTFTAGVGYSSIGRTGTTGGNAANNITINPEYRIVSATGTHAATGTLGASRLWATAIVTYKAAVPSATKLVIALVNGGSNVTAGTSFPVVIQSQSQSGTPANVVSSTDIRLLLKTGTGVLGGTLTGTIAAGTNQVIIPSVTYTKAEGGVVMTASRTSGDALTAGDSAVFTVNAGPATALVFTNQPLNSIAGGAIVGSPTITISDSFGNAVTSSNATITVALESNPGAGTLSGNTTVNASAGVAAFNNLSINKAGAGYTLTASAAGLVSTTSNAFNISAATASTLVFSTQPTSAVAANAIGGPPTVRVHDSFGNLVSTSTAIISIGLGANPGSGTLAGTTTQNAVGGIVSFTNLTIDKAGIGYTLVASSAGLSGATSTAFDVAAGNASKLVFTMQPTTSTAGVSIGGPATVTVQDSSGNTITSSAAPITMTIGNNPGGSTLSGNVSANAVSGVATFNNLSLNKAGAGYTLTASSPGLTSATSTAFNINPGPAAALVFTTQPGNATSGSNLPGPPTVAVQDGLGNAVTSSTASITIGLGANPSGAILSGTTTKNAVSGIASFNNLSLDVAGIGFTLVASASGLASVTSNSFNVTAAGQVSMAAIPTSAPAGDSFIVTWGQITNPTSKDWIGLFTVGSSDEAVVDWWWVSCTRTITVPVASGTCSFPIPTFRTPGPYDFRLFANDTFNRLAISNAVTIAPPSNQNKVAISVAATVTAGTPGFSVTVQSKTSAGGLVNVMSNTNITVSLLLGNGVLGGTLNGTILAGTNETVIGPVTYSKAESGVVLTASRTSGDDLRAQNSLPFSVIPGPAAQLAFTTQPGNAAIGSTIPGPPTVTVQDNAGNAVTSTTATINIALGANPGGATLDDNLTVTYGSSVSFPALILNQTGNGYTLVASSAGLQSATSNPFNITLAGGGGTIAGVITRVSNGATISGALVEAFEGITLRGTAVTNASGNYTITGLATGIYTVRASFTGLVPQMLNNVQVISSNTTNVSLSLNFGIAVQSPVASATINDFNVLVTGNFDTSLAPQVGIQVNGYAVLIDGNEFATIIPLDSQTTTVTATMTDSSGNFLAGDAVPVTAQIPTTEPTLIFRASPAIALVSEPVGFTLISRNEISQVQLDGNGDDIIDFTGPTLEGVSVTYAEPGLYFPTVRVTDTANTEFIGSGIVQVLDPSQHDAALRAMWDSMKNALRIGNTTLAASYIVSNKRADYQNIFNNLTIPYSAIDQMLGNITYQGLKGLEIEYEMLMDDGPDGYVSYTVQFSLDADGIWRISFF